MWHRIAEVLGCTVWEAKLRMGLDEFVAWIAYFELKREYEEATMKGGKPPPPKAELLRTTGSVKEPLPPHVPTRVYKKKRPIPEY